LKTIVIKEHIMGLMNPSKRQSRGVRSEIVGGYIIENRGTNIWLLKDYIPLTLKAGRPPHY
jgi:hypothetical protein